MGAAIGAGAVALALLSLIPSGTGTSTGSGRRPTPSPSASQAHAQAHPASVTPSSTDIKRRTVAYGKHVHQRMDMWWHTSGAPRPAIVVIHGGWWSGGDKKTMTTISRNFARLGYTVANIDYRLSGEAAWPAQRTDTLSAISEMRKIAAHYNTDPGRYVIVGFSAGGQIAAAVATYENGLPGLRGVVGVSPVISPLTAFADGDAGGTNDQRKLRSTAIKLAGGCGPTECPGTWSSMEVAEHVSPKDAPMFTVHSKDEFVPPYQSELLKRALESVGVPMRIMVKPGTAHSAPLYREPGVAQAVYSWIAARVTADR
ncbi:hypothetical protein Pth03_54200 [Planotetraspora thailandica]|uniref:BD-FAE-like domain-containing protein n=1 Tax=Planotetraspora thailandica TaxID=487172 RepID=A0A8J3V8W8_9ACTN|nr:hypothetical protein Pth03_54200 [Planotetraspora thailandica]